MMRPSPFLRRVLMIDAVASAATGALLAFGAGILPALFGLPEDLLRYSGIALLPFAVLLAYIATRDALPRMLVWVVIIANALWVVDSLWLLVSGWVAPTALGVAFVLAQAAAVAVLTELEYIALRRASLAAA